MSESMFKWSTRVGVGRVEHNCYLGMSDKPIGTIVEYPEGVTLCMRTQGNYAPTRLHKYNEKSEFTLIKAKRRIIMDKFL